MKNIMLSTQFILLIALAGTTNTCLIINSTESQAPNFFGNLRHTAARMAAFLRINESKKQLPKQEASMMLAENVLPIVIYLPSDKKIELIQFPNNAPSLKDNFFHRYFPHITSYALSPQKKYLLIDTTSAVSIVTRFSSWFGQQTSSTNTTKLINVHDGSEIAFFSGKKVTYQFSPDEKTLLIAMPQKSLGEQLGWTQPSTTGAAVSGYRTQAESGEILRYELFDITSKKVLKTFENIQSIDYIAEDKLRVIYDDTTQQEITITRNAPLSSFWSVINLAANLNLDIVVKEENRAPATEISLTITYYDDTKKLIIKNKEIESAFEKVESYIISPDKKFILVQHQPLSTSEYIKTLIPTVPWSAANIPAHSGTTLFNTTTQKTQKLPNNFITYEFSPDGTKLLILMSAGESELPHYCVIDLKNTEITPVPKSKTAYFTHTNNLAYITDNNEKKEISFTKKELEKTTPIRQAVSSAATATQKQASEYWTSAQKKATELTTQAKNYIADLTKPFWSLTEEQLAKQKQEQLKQQEREQRQREFEAEKWKEESDDEVDEDDEDFFDQPDLADLYNQEEQEEEITE